MSQCSKILEHLQTKGPLTQADAVRLFGCYRLAARVADLKKAGYPVTSYTNTKTAETGETIHYAVYYLAAEEEETNA